MYFAIDAVLRFHHRNISRTIASSWSFRHAC